MPWYAALLVAITATAIGYGIDAGHKELTHVFAGFYIAGCVAAVLAVRQEGLFTAIIQPPLILFCAVPGAYWLFHDAKIGHLKDLLINCGYPLIERFPLMLGTAGAVLLIGLPRWYYGMSQRPVAAAKTSDDDAAAPVGGTSVVGGFVAKLQSLLHPQTGDADETPSTARRSRRTTSSSRNRRTARSSRSSARSRSRQGRPPVDGAADPAERRASRRSSATRDYDAADPPRRSQRRPRPEADADPRRQSPREPRESRESREARREPRTRRSPYERPTPRSSRFDGYEMYDPPGTPENFGRYESRERHDRYEPGYEPRRRRPSPNGNNGTHHPISQVRYRGAGGSDEPGDEPRSERRGRSRTTGRSQRRPSADSWEYDV